MQNRRFALIALVASILLAPFAFFSMKPSPWKDSAVAVSSHEILYVFESGIDGMVNSLRSTWNRYVMNQSAFDENNDLRLRLERLQTRIIDYEEQVQENMRLRRLLGFTTRYKKSLMPAEVVSIGGKEPFVTLRVARGENDGVKAGMPVVSADGVVGKIIRTGQDFSDVELLVDGHFKLDVLLQRTRVRGVLSGSGSNLCQLNLHRRAEIRIGDTIITSGIVGAFPKGLPVGRVVRISYETENVAQTVTIEPWVDYRSLEEVMILFRNDQELQKIVETAGPQWLEFALDHASGGR